MALEEEVLRLSGVEDKVDLNLLLLRSRRPVVLVCFLPNVDLYDILFDTPSSFL